MGKNTRLKKKIVLLAVAVLCAFLPTMKAQLGPKKFISAGLHFEHDTTHISKVIFLNCVIGKRLTVYKCKVRNEFVMRFCELNDRVYFEGSTLQGLVYFDYNSFNSDAEFTNVYFARQAVFSESLFKDKCEFTGNTFIDSAVFEKTKWKGMASFARNKFSAPVSFLKAEFRSYTLFADTFYRACNFDGAVFGSTVSFAGASFSRTSFCGTTFDSLVLFKRARFDSIAVFHGSSFKHGSRIDFEDAEFKGPVRFRNARLFGECDFSDVVFEKRAEFDSTYFDKKTDFSEASFHSVSFKKAEFNSEVSFKDTYFSDTLSFNHASFRGNVFFNSETRLPPYVDFSYVDWIEKTIDFTGCKTANNQMVRINLIGTDISKVKIDYLHFRLDFNQMNLDNKDDFEKIAAVYKELLTNFDKNNLVSSYEILDKEFTGLKYRHSMGSTWVKIFSPYFWLEKIDQMWWDYGYKKGYIFIWTVVLLAFFSSGTYFWYPKLKVIYPSRIMPYENSGLTYQKLPFRKRIYCAAIYTSIIFFSLNVKLDAITWKPKRYLIFLVILYATGLICEGYIINYVLAK